MSVIKDEFDRVYITKYIDELGISEIANSFHTGKNIIENIIKELKNKGLYKYYKDMPEAEWENLSGRTRRRQNELIEEGFKRFQKDLFYEFVDTLREEGPIFDKYFELKFLLEIKGEEWKKIPQFDYSISNYGRIKNNKNGKLKNTRLHKWQIIVDLYKDGKRHTIDVPRLEACLFIKPLLKTERVSYIDGDKRNSYYKNFKIVSK